MAAAAARQQGPPLGKALVRVIPIGFAVGAAMETFMYFTGFYGVATRKEAERRMERASEREARQKAAAAALAALPPSKAAAGK